jgi:hypothetical protein
MQALAAREAMMEAKKELIKLYFTHIEGKLEKIRDISKISEEEALMLCCCHIEALGARQYREIEYVNPPRKALANYSKSAVFTEILVRYSSYDFWDKIHPIGLLGLMPKIFNNNYQDYVIALSEIGYELREKEFVIDHVKNLFENSVQKEWFNKHIHKGTIGNIAYSKVRSEIVHNISHQPITFLAKWQGKDLPDIDFILMERCLSNIIDQLKAVSFHTGTFWWEQ